MNPKFTLLFISLILHFLILHKHYSVVYSNSVDDHDALLAIKSQITHDPHGVLNSWNHTLPVYKWHGVSCGTRHPHRVVGLYLANNDLVGTLSPYVGNLSFLHVLQLNNNSFGGHIPPQIGNLLRLKSLGLVRNTFEGEIPANLSRCFNLEELHLGFNHLSGIVPSQLGLLSRLVLLSLSYNQLSGDLLNKVIVNMTSLKVLSASGNSFHGSIPDNIGATHKHISSFEISQNNLSGIIPPSFCNLSNLQEINLDNNQIQGTLPSFIGVSLHRLTYFHISNNFFHGNLPASISNLTQLEQLSVYSNNFTGKFMFDATIMPNLLSLDISLNHLGTGKENDLSFIETLVNCSYLQELECGGNNFGGILPDSLGNITTLTTIDFQLNKIHGNIPSTLYNLVNLRFLDLQTNQLSGHISPQIEKLTKLEILDIDSNYLTGNLPNSWGNLSHLAQLYLANNTLQGTIPSSLGNCSNLVHLLLLLNNFSGALPPQLFHPSSMLVRLRLEHNRLQGVIPDEIGQLSNLVQLVVSENTMSGDLPTTLGSCIELVDLELGGNFFTGYIPQSYKLLTSLSSLNLSHNKLSGLIPNFFEKFPLIGLDLSFNDFEGEVPRKGVFANLSALKIHGNSKLCGGIPDLHLPTCPTKRKGSKLSVAVTVIIAVASLVVGVSIVSLAYFLLCSRRKQNKSSCGSELNLIEPFSKVSYHMLLKATNKFSEENSVGKGSFGSVYKGVLDPESNLIVAVKVISLEKKGATKSFMAECEALRSIRHRNLLKIVTVCSSTDFQGNDFKALVYEFMTNGSLHQWIHTDQLERTLSLLQRLEIAIDVGSALDYLHNGCDVPVIHCDLKPSNVLLDDSMVAHVGDFGLARLLHLHVTANTGGSSSVAVRGTVGYAAPEYGLGSAVSTEGDIYSYGIVLLEMVTAIAPTDGMFEGVLDLHKYAKSALLTDQFFKIIDPRLLDDDNDASIGAQEVKLAGHGNRMKCIRSLLEIGVKCSMESPQDRMGINDAIKELRVAKAILLKELQR